MLSVGRERVCPSSRQRMWPGRREMFALKVLSCKF